MISLVFIVDGGPQVNHKWPVLPPDGVTVVLGKGGPNERKVQVVRSELYNNTLGECAADVHCISIKKKGSKK